MASNVSVIPDCASVAEQVRQSVQDIELYEDKIIERTACEIRLPWRPLR